MRGKVLKRKQRIRVEKGRDRAEAVGDKLAQKKKGERGSGRKGEGRNVSSVLCILFYIAPFDFLCGGVWLVLGGKQGFTCMVGGEGVIENLFE